MDSAKTGYNAEDTIPFLSVGTNYFILNKVAKFSSDLNLCPQNILKIQLRRP